MNTLLVAGLSFIGFIVAYNTYGRWLSGKIFGLDRQAVVPSVALKDGVDFVPTRKQIIFGHHFTSIAGTGPIVGPAIAVFWGWLPALLWVVFGSILIGGVHDLGTLVVSLRNRGQTVGQIAGRLINARTRLLFMLILFLSLTVVLAIFGLVIANIFALYPSSVFSSWIVLPLAMGFGWWVYKKGGGLIVPTAVAMAVLYGGIWAGAQWWPIDLAKIQGVGPSGSWNSPVMIWTMILMVYCFIASVMPVNLLLQPRDYLNSQQLILAMGLMVLGMVVAGLTGVADMNAAPMISDHAPADAPPVLPFLFITVACGACSGFHCLVSSGTSSKQVANEMDAKFVGYGSMLLEGALAVIVIITCCAGLGMGVSDGKGGMLTGRTAWESRYPSEIKAVLDADGVPATKADGSPVTTGGWAGLQLKQQIGAFVDGGANLMGTLGLPKNVGVALIAVLVATFAATTMDTAMRLQRYVIEELAGSLGIAPLRNKYVATTAAAALALALACVPGPSGPGSGGFILWPLFGATNQLLAGLAFMVILAYLWRRGKPVGFVAIPLAIMVLLPAWALGWQIFNGETGWLVKKNYLLASVGLVVMGLQAWMVIEGLLVLRKARGILETQLPPLAPRPDAG